MSDSITSESFGGAQAITIKPPKSRGRVAAPIPQTILVATDFPLESGAILPKVELRYETYGNLNESKSNAVLVFHAWTGSAHLAGSYADDVLEGFVGWEKVFGSEGWWDELAGPGRMLDTDTEFVICANHLGSCYGSTGPASVDPLSNKVYGPDFPEISVRDIATTQALLLGEMGIEKVVLLGGSLGGMIALEFALLFPEKVEKFVILGAPPVHGPWARAFNRLSRESILRDRDFLDGNFQNPLPGLELARAISMLSFRSPDSFNQRWLEAPEQGESYVFYQGEKFAKRFDPYAFLVLSNAMDSHNVGRGRGGVASALSRLQKIPSVFVGINSDILYTAKEVRDSARFAGGKYEEIRSLHGHDAFLIETDQVERILANFL